jgi:hypothetical protein
MDDSVCSSALKSSSGTVTVIAWEFPPPIGGGFVADIGAAVAKAMDAPSGHWPLQPWGFSKGTSPPKLGDRECCSLSPNEPVTLHRWSVLGCCAHRGSQIHTAMTATTNAANAATKSIAVGRSVTRPTALHAALPSELWSAP